MRPPSFHPVAHARRNLNFKSSTYSTPSVVTKCCQVDLFEHSSLSPFSIPISSSLGHALITIFPTNTRGSYLLSPLGALLPGYDYLSKCKLIVSPASFHCPPQKPSLPPELQGKVSDPSEQPILPPLLSRLHLHSCSSHTEILPFPGNTTHFIHAVPSAWPACPLYV